MRCLTALLLLSAWPGVAWTQVDSAAPTRIALTGVGGASLGYVVLGVSHTEDVRHVLDSLGGLGPQRENKVTFTIGTLRMRPRRLYTPPGTMNQLYFDNDVLVFLVEGDPRGLPRSRAEFLTRFPAARETHRETGWYEMQTQLSHCHWLIAVFGTADDQLQSDGHAYTCATR